MYNTDLPTRAELPTAGKLLRSTAGAAVIAAGLLVTTILPAEYGIDPTGVGRVLGLAQMGEIKNLLATEASALETQTPPAANAAHAAEPAVPATAAAAAPSPHGHEHAHEHTPGAAPAATSPAAPGAAAAAAREHTVTVRLKPGEAAEIKLTMEKDAAVRYEWSTVGGGVNYDTHGDPVNAPKDFYHGYGKGKNETADAGTLQAAFDGKHGWFWRNRSGAEVTVTLKTSGAYGQIERVL